VQPKISLYYIFFISGVSLIFLDLLHSDNWNTLVDGSFDVINRTPHWKVNQSRLMGPALLKVITVFNIISGWLALKLFVLFFVTLNNIFLVLCLSNITDSKYEILNALIIFNSLFIISQDVWLFAWDFIDITFFIFYGFLLFKNEYLKYLVPINFLHIFNRESALIMASFFILILFFEKNKNIKKLFKDKIFLGLTFNFLFGLIYTYFSRKILFIRQSDYTGGGQDLNNNFLGGNWVTPMYNYNSLFNGENVSNALIILSLFLVFFLIIKNYKNFNALQKKLSFGVIVNILPIFIFGIFTETRQYFPAIVLITYLIFSTSYKQSL
tara:strand:+ start:232 stop:1206 length:975 start_codon:yes stop_codon:yes gene_type:complete